MQSKKRWVKIDPTLVLQGLMTIQKQLNFIPGLGTEIKMNIDINLGVTEIHVLNIDINFGIPKFRF